MKGATFKFIREEFKDTLDALGKAIGNDGERIKPYDAATTAAHRLKELVEGGYITIVLHKVRKED